MVVVAELLRAGAIDGHNLANMARRLNMADLPDEAERILSLPLSNTFDSPEELRASMHLVGDEPSGGNEPA